MKTRLFLLMVLVLVFATAALAADPIIGSWKLNVARSSTSSNTPKSETLKIEAIENGFKTTMDGINADGKTFHSENLFRFDGKEYQFPWPESFAIYTKIGDSRFFCVIKKEGKEMGRMLNVISSDGRTGTLVFMGKNSKGQDFLNTRAYDKQ